MLLKGVVLVLLCIHLTAGSYNDDQLDTIPQAPTQDQDEGAKEIVWDFTRKKRAVHDYTVNWVGKIPYVIDPTYQAYGPYYTTLLKRSLQYIMDNVCLTFVDETSRWNSSDPKWFTKNGYTYDTYISVQASTGCSAFSGPGNGVGNSPRIVYPCQDFVINLHEMMHTLGVAHAHQGFLRENYITINVDDIQSSLIYSYDMIPASSQFVNLFFDPSSALMYGARTWTRNGNEAYTPIRDDLFNTITSVSADSVNFLELVQVLKCTERYCGGKTVDCTPGYYSYVKGVCRCVCPDEFDITTNCKTLKNGPSPLAQWPNTPMVVFAGGPSHSCPTGFNPTPGWFSFTGSYAMTQTPGAPVQYPVSGTTNYFPVCTRNLPAGTTADWESWPPGGQYCFIKPAGVNCGGAFVEAGGYAVSAASISTNGSIGDITISSNNVSIKACCRYQEFSNIAIDLPDGEPFRLLTRSTCPSIRGLKAYNSRLNLWTTNSGVFGPAESPFWWFSTSLTTYSCYYQPGVYGCNELVTLDANNRSVTIRTPFLLTGYREPNRRCFYAFSSPPNSQILITFNRYSLSTTMDDFFVKKYHPWQVAFKLDNANYPAQILSESNYFSAEAFMGYSATTNYGVNFTAQVILPEDYCYDSSTNGADYRGKTAISETYEPCIEWSKAVNCSNFPKGDQIANILSGNECRNPDGRRGPWCYTYINGTNCNIRYCDACNFMKPIDALTKCATLKASNPNFCSTGVQRLGCFVSCNFSVESTTRAVCGPPTIPTDAQVVGTLKSQYLEGEKVQVKCILYNDTGLPNDMYCTATGWTTLYQACRAS
ncbi:uncharacterized protein LOC131954644 [Physella acuta]|uniref:uncharacterized protein LOC131954644 n=1 Tax=Physella acuta TaxID=109671 RepID=UPI0027DCEB5D|nr:uncharacterized protein LOC131954644 [Physella acuta]